MTVQLTVCENVNASTRIVFDAAVSIDARTLIQKTGFLPGVHNVEGHDAPWSTVGEIRQYTLTDKSSVREELTNISPSKNFTYRLTKFTGAFAPLISGARADWHFTQLGQEKTKIEWTYAFTPTSAIAEPIVWFIVKLFWPRYLKNALERVKERAESPS
ncbi:SRPBCC family protein [Hyphococcus lacteus]|uniref:SRPBCC family protein n=1 Tax=Hyphococcus lacteus TaxID=3143536 RepID=A0ABV3Z727_9PROT